MIFVNAGILATNSVSASVGSEKGSFRMSASHIAQKGVVPNTGVNNTSFSFGGNYALTSKLSMDAKLTYNREYSDNYPTIGYGPPNILYNLLLWIGPDVDIRDLKDYWVKGQEGLQQKNYNLSWYNNPYFVVNELLNGYKRSNSFGQTTFDYQITKDLSAKLRTGFNQFSSDKDVKEPYSYIAYDYISKGNYSVTTASYFDITTDLILNYKHRFSNNFNINVTAYPSAGISAVLSDVLDLPQPISFLKARASWAKVNTGFIGDGADPYSHLTNYDIGDKWNNVPSLSWPSTAKSPDLIPATVQSGEYGVAAGFFNNRITVDATWFRNKEYNNLIEVPLSEASGFGTLLKNANVYVRKGWEFVINAVPVKSRDFRWETGVNFSSMHKWLKDATDDPDGYFDYKKEGSRNDAIFITQSRAPDGQAIYNSNGMQAFEPYAQFFGYSDADWIYGWQNTFAYKNLSLRFSVDGRLGGLIYSTTNQKMWWGGTAPGTVNQYRDDANEGKATFVGPGVVIESGKVDYDAHGNVISDTRKFAPNTKAVNYISFMQATSGGMMNNYFYYKGTYLKMRELVLTYDLPGKLTKGVFNSASVSLIGNNLFILAKLPNVDPDSEKDNLQTPSMRSMGVNINLKF